MSSEDVDLKAALREVLEKRGVLGALRARVRAEVFEALEEGETAGGGGRPAPCRENLVLNELIREYLVYNNYNYTASVLLQESGQPKEGLQRELLAAELGLPAKASQDQQLPLLYSVLCQPLPNPQAPSDEQADPGSSGLQQLQQQQPSALVIQGKT